MRSLLSRWSDWAVRHPVRWVASGGGVLVLLGLALDLPPIIVIAAGATIGVLNILHGSRHGYCPRPTRPEPHRDRAGRP
jgi:hypothetical protein